MRILYDFCRVAYDCLEVGHFYSLVLETKGESRLYCS